MYRIVQYENDKAVQARTFYTEREFVHAQELLIFDYEQDIDKSINDNKYTKCYSVGTNIKLMLTILVTLVGVKIIQTYSEMKPQKMV